MPGHVCPWWMGYLLISPFRRLIQNPEKILSPFICPDMTTLDIGCGMGFFSLDMAKMVGPGGNVICVDLQHRMIQTLVSRAEKAGLSDRIEARVCSKNSLGLEDMNGQIDFAVAIAIIHEVPDAQQFLSQIYSAMKPDGRFLVIEPKGHVSKEKFTTTESEIKAAGFILVEHPIAGKSHTALFKR